MALGRHRREERITLKHERVPNLVHVHLRKRDVAPLRPTDSLDYFLFDKFPRQLELPILNDLE